MFIDGAHQERAAADEGCGGDASFQGVFQQAGADPFSRPGKIGGELTEQEARHGIGWLAGADAAGERGGDDRRRRKAEEAGHSAGIMHHDNGAEAFVPVG